MRTLEVVDADPRWAQWFVEIAAYVAPALNATSHVEHVGSTAVAELDGKPVIDVDVVVARASDLAPTTEHLVSIGYTAVGDLGVAERDAFVAPDEAALPPHHLYLVVANSRPHVDHVLFRDELRSEPELRLRYGALKRENARKAMGDRDWYVAAKADFVAEVLTRARAKGGDEPVEYWRPDVEERA